MATSLLVLFVTLRLILRSRVDLQLENLALRHQIGVLQRSVKKRPKLTPVDPSIAFSGFLCPASGAIGARRWFSLSRKRLWPGIVGGFAGFGLGRFDRDVPDALPSFAKLKI